LNPDAGDARAVLDSVRRLVQMLRVSARAAERAVGISGAQMFVLERLAAAKEPLSVGELAERTLTHQSSVSVVVQKLERAGLVARSRSDTDGRRIELSITPKARAVLRRAPPAAQDRIIDAVNAMPPARRKQLAQLLSELAGTVGDDAPPPMMFEDSPDTDPARKTPRARTRS
jgi:DNA-binding MarR family transcriptional regulator